AELDLEKNALFALRAGIVSSLKRCTDFCQACIDAGAFRARIADDGRGGRLSPAFTAQAVRFGGEWSGAVHQGHRQMAVSAGCASSLARGGNHRSIHLEAASPTPNRQRRG